MIVNGQAEFVGSDEQRARREILKAAQEPTANVDLAIAGDIVNIKANECLDVKDRSTADRAHLQLWSCSGNSNQKWRLG